LVPNDAIIWTDSPLYNSISHGCRGHISSVHQLPKLVNTHRLNPAGEVREKKNDRQVRFPCQVLKIQILHIRTLTIQYFILLLLLLLIIIIIIIIIMTLPMALANHHHPYNNHHHHSHWFYHPPPPPPLLLVTATWKLNWLGVC
jgi:hypothetical protein